MCRGGEEEGGGGCMLVESTTPHRCGCTFQTEHINTHTQCTHGLSQVYGAGRGQLKQDKSRACACVGVVGRYRGAPAHGMAQRALPWT